MSHNRRFRFGVDMVGPFDVLTWAESAQELARMGYSAHFVPAEVPRAEHRDGGGGDCHLITGRRPDGVGRLLLVGFRAVSVVQFGVTWCSFRWDPRISFATCCCPESPNGSRFVDDRRAHAKPKTLAPAGWRTSTSTTGELR